MKKALLAILMSSMVMGMSGCASGTPEVTEVTGAEESAQETQSAQDTQEIEETKVIDGSQIKMGLQMYNFVAGGDWEQVKSLDDVEEVLTQIADAGYDGVEWCNFQLDGDYMDVEAVKDIMDSLGLETCGMHFHFGSADTLEADAKQVVERSLVLGTDNLIFAYSTPSVFGIEPDENGEWTPEQLDEWADDINQVIDALQDAAEGTGMKVLYHNHNTEFLQGSNGEYINDMVTSDGKELDVYWASKGMDGKVSTALEYVNNNIDNVYLLHVKDGLDGSVYTGEMCGWGKGTFDIQSIVDVARTSDTIEWVIVENDAPYNFNTLAIDDAVQSANYAKKNIDFTKE